MQQRSGGRRGHNLELTRSNLALNLLMMGDAAAARELALLGAPCAAAYLIVGPWADALAHLAALEQRPRCAARLCGFADVAYRAADDSRVNESTAARAGAEQLARAALGDTAFGRRRMDGETLDADTAWRLGLDTRES